MFLLELDCRLPILWLYVFFAIHTDSVIDFTIIHSSRCPLVLIFHVVQIRFIYVIRENRQIRLSSWVFLFVFFPDNLPCTCDGNIFVRDSRFWNYVCICSISSEEQSHLLPQKLIIIHICKFSLTHRSVRVEANCNELSFFFSEKREVEREKVFIIYKKKYLDVYLFIRSFCAVKIVRNEIKS